MDIRFIDVEVVLPISTITDLNPQSADVSLRNQLRLLVEEILEKVKVKGSGWKYTKNIDIKIKMTAWTPTKVGSFIKTPKIIALTKSVINVEDHKDYPDQCIRFSLAAALFYDKVAQHRDRPNNWIKFFDQINMGVMPRYPFICNSKNIQKLENLIIFQSMFMRLIATQKKISDLW